MPDGAKAAGPSRLASRCLCMVEGDPEAAKLKGSICLARGWTALGKVSCEKLPCGLESPVTRRNPKLGRVLFACRGASFK